MPKPAYTSSHFATAIYSSTEFLYPTGSVVIHYDCWWNAAREDHATDRVHRIRQRRAVQIFKLVSSGTLEEKISTIIERKRKLIDSVVQADDSHLGKVFSRSELIELLRPL
jgi:SNF2 family DNA or RNA helicase